jgi:hypothetical protein
MNGHQRLMRLHGPIVLDVLPGRRAVWTGVLALGAVRHVPARGWTARIRAP